jgi:hypothetical protein
MKKKTSKINSEPLLKELDLILVETSRLTLDVPGPTSQFRKPKGKPKGKAAKKKATYIPVELSAIAWRLEKVEALNDRLKTESEECGKVLQGVLDRLEKEKNINRLLQVANCLARYESLGFSMSRFFHEAVYRVLEGKPKEKKEKRTGSTGCRRPTPASPTKPSPRQKRTKA